MGLGLVDESLDVGTAWAEAKRKLAHRNDVASDLYPAPHASHLADHYQE